MNMAATRGHLRNPIGTGHTPHIGDEGALILVKLPSFPVQSLILQLAVPAHRLPWQPDRSPGITYKMLHTFGQERASLRAVGGGRDDCLPQRLAAAWKHLFWKAPCVTAIPNTRRAAGVAILPAPPPNLVRAAPGVKLLLKTRAPAA